MRPKFLDLKVDPAESEVTEVPPEGEASDFVAGSVGGVTAPAHYVETETDLPPPGPLSFRMKEFARLISLGRANHEIADTMGVTPTRVSIIRSLPAVQAEAERYRDRLFEGDVKERLKELNSAAFSVAEEMLAPGTKDNLRWDAAKWLLEKTTGKAAQAIDVKSSTLDAFYGLLLDMKNRGEVIDVSPAKPELLESQAASSGESPQPEESFNASRWVEDQT